MKKILMVCLGNICRSPLAEGILAHKVKENALDWYVDSAGTGNWHVGNLPDPRSIKVANNHGIDLTNQRARQFQAKDFEDFDLIFAMDSSNYKNIIALAKNKSDIEKVFLIRNLVTPNQNLPVPDPYYSGEEAYEEVYLMLNEACDVLLKM